MSKKYIGIRCYHQGEPDNSQYAGITAVIQDPYQFLRLMNNSGMEDAEYEFIWNEDGPDGPALYRNGVAYPRSWSAIDGLEIQFPGRTEYIIDEETGLIVDSVFHPGYRTGDTIRVVVGSSIDDSLYDVLLLNGGIKMADNYKLEWDKTGERYYENGVSHGVLFPQNDDGTYAAGVAWNGLTNVTKSPEGAEPNDLWADNLKYGTLRSAETFGGNIEAYTYPKEFRPCIGLETPEGVDGLYIGQQKHKPFGFCFRTEIGSDTGAEAYKIHIVYGATASPSEEAFDTINDSPDAITFSWDFDTIPVNVEGTDFKPTACLVVDSRYANSTKLATLLQTLYGTAATVGDNATPAVDPRLPSPSEVITALTPGQ